MNNIEHLEALLEIQREVTRRIKGMRTACGHWRSRGFLTVNKAVVATAVDAVLHAVESTFDSGTN